MCGSPFDKTEHDQSNSLKLQNYDRVNDIHNVVRETGKLHNILQLTSSVVMHIDTDRSLQVISKITEKYKPII